MVKKLDEIWKDIKGYEGKYQVSNKGRVKSFLQFESGRILHPAKERHDYLRVTLQGKPAKVHRLVAMHFIENPNNLPHVNHKDADKSNNSAENLEWVTHQQNMAHALENNLIGKESKLTRKQIHEIRKRYNPREEKNTATALSEEFGVGRGYIIAIAEGRGLSSKKYLKDTNAYINGKCVCPHCGEVIFEIEKGSYYEDYLVICKECGKTFELNTPILKISPIVESGKAIRDRWTKEDDEYILSHNIKDCLEKMSRTRGAINQRKYKLRHGIAKSVV